MNKIIKLTDDGFEKLKKAIGVDFGVFNLDSGSIKIGRYGYEDTILQIDKLYGIHEIDGIHYNIIPAQREAQEELAERIRIIGREIRVGSVVKIKLDGQARHVVVVAINGICYECALMNLKIANMNEVPNHAIRLHKGSDILYNNLTYREVVEVTDTVIPNVKKHDFLRGGGIVAGRIINEYTLMRIIKMCKQQKTAPEAMNAIEVIPHENCETIAEEPGNSKNNSALTPEEDADTSDSDVVGDCAVEGGDVSSRDLNFEQVVATISELNACFDALEIESDFLKLAMRICVENQRVNMKNLYANMQGRQEELHLPKKLSQNAIKNIVAQDFVIWLGDKRVIIEKAEVGYFLKTIIKNVKV